MAGSYPDHPAPRLPLDLDGSVLFIGTTQQTNATLKALQDDSSAGVNIPGFGTATILFPTPRVIKGAHIAFPYVSASQYSTDTTNGVDGTWTATGALPSRGTTAADLRLITALDLTNVKAMRFSSSNNSSRLFSTWHLYGWPVSASGDRLDFWDPTLDQRLAGAALDWGDVQQNATPADKTFRIKNASATLTAAGVTVATEVLTDATPSLASQITYSLDGSAFTSTVSLPDLDPGDISPVVTVRYRPVLSAALSLWSWRTKVTSSLPAP
jgi:hypothetical protein